MCSQRNADSSGRRGLTSQSKQSLSVTGFFSLREFRKSICRFSTPSAASVALLHTHAHARTHTHLFNGPLSGTTRVSRYQKETVSGSGISWAICKSAPRSRQITMPALHRSVCLQAGCPFCRPTNSVNALKAKKHEHTPEWIHRYLNSNKK